MGNLTISNIVEVIRAADAPVVSTSEIAERTGFTRQHVDQFLRKYGDSQIESVNVGNSKGWYLNEVQHPAAILENQLDGAHLIKLSEVDCNKCHESITDGEELVALFERSNLQWEILDALCLDHVDGRSALLTEFGYDKYMDKSSERIEYVVCRGVCERKQDDRYGRSVIRDPVIMQYFPRTAPEARDELRPPEPIQ